MLLTFLSSKQKGSAMLQKTFSWTEENIGRLKQMADQGKSASQIGAELFTSRNSVIGKCSRLGITLSGSPGGSVKRLKDGTKVRWTEELIDKAAGLWQEGIAAFDIAQTIGCTPAALVSIADRHRERFPYRGRYSHQNRQTPVSEPVCVKEDVLAETYEPVEIVPEDIPFLPVCEDALTVRNLQPHHCRWPLGGSGENIVHCGKDKMTAKSYCHAHYVKSVGRGTISERRALKGLV